MSEAFGPYEQIASEEYWHNPQRMPKVPLSPEIVDGFSGVSYLAAHGAIKIMRLYRSATIRGHVAEQVPVGGALPVVPRGEGLLRVIEDMRQFPVSQSLLARAWNSKKKDDTEDTFNELATRMKAEKLYHGEAARSTIDVDNERQMRIWRVVWYMTGSKSGHMLNGISSAELSSNPNHILFLKQVPPLVVGTPYRLNRHGTIMSKIVAADVLIPGSGSRQTVSRRSKLKVSPRPALNF